MRVSVASAEKPKERKGDPRVWFNDSGASDHMTGHKEILQDFDDSVSGTVSWGDGAKSPVLGKGSVIMKLRKNYGDGYLKLKEVYYVPDVHDNLMSERQFDKSGYQITTKGNCKKISDKAGDFLVSYWNEEAQMYEAKAKYVEEGWTMKKKKEEKKLSISIRGDRSQVQLWHQRFGHLKQLPEVCKVKEVEEDCETCLKAKSKRKPFPESDRKTESVLEIVHSDLCSIRETAPDGSKYFITFLDDYSRFSEVRILKKKSESLSSFKKYLAKVERFHEKKLKCLQSDNGGEYMGKEFQQFLEEAGIDRRLIVPHNPEQHGKAEKLNQTLLQVARCMLIHAGLPSMFWPAAIEFANFLRNRARSRVISNKTPFELWNGRKLEEEDLKFIKVFGCEVWIRRNDKPKILDRATKGLYMGIQPGVKGVKVYDLQEKRFTIAVHVEFREENFPMKPVIICSPPLKENSTTLLLVSEDEDDAEEAQEDKSDTEEEKENQNHDEENTGGGGPTHTNSEGEAQGSLGGEEENGETANTDNASKVPLCNHAEPRKSSRVRKPKVICSCCNKAMTDILEISLENQDPKTIQEALASQNSEMWLEAVNEEMSRLHGFETWVIVPRPSDKNIVGSRWVFTKRINEHGEVMDFKARLVARGFSLTPGIDFSDTYAPVVRKSTIRLLLALAVEKGWCAEQIDIKSAYLNSKLNDTVFMEQPPGCEVSDPSEYVCKLSKSIYGLPQSAHNWNEELDSTLREKLKLKKSQYDQCLYYRENLIIGFHVDDFIIIGIKPEVDLFKKQIKQFYEIKDLGRIKNLLGTLIHVCDSGGVKIHQTHYIQDVLQQFRITEETKGLTTVLNSDYKLEEDSPEFCGFIYRSATGSLQHLVNNTRPDVAFAVSTLSQKNQNPTRKNWTNVKHLLRYLKQTKDLAIRYQKTGAPLKTFVDADWSANRSTTGYVIILGGGPIHWKSQKQKLTAQSSNDAEYIALSEASREVLYFKGLLREINFPEFAISPSIIYIDNQGAMKKAEGRTNSEKSKYIDTKYHLVKEEILRGRIKLEYVPSADNLADVLTKLLSGTRTRELCKKMGLLEAN